MDAPLDGFPIRLEKLAVDPAAIFGVYPAAMRPVLSSPGPPIHAILLFMT
jgi:hypothetical protein